MDYRINKNGADTCINTLKTHQMPTQPLYAYGMLLAIAHVHTDKIVDYMSVRDLTDLIGGHLATPALGVLFGVRRLDAIALTVSERAIYAVALIAIEKHMGVFRSALTGRNRTDVVCALRDTLQLVYGVKPATPRVTPIRPRRPADRDDGIGDRAAMV